MIVAMRFGPSFFGGLTVGPSTEVFPVGGEAVEQLGVVADLAVEERPAVGGVAPLDGRQEQGLDSLGVDRHVRASQRGPFPT